MKPISIAPDVVHRCGKYIRESGLFSKQFAKWWVGRWPQRAGEVVLYRVGGNHSFDIPDTLVWDPAADDGSGGFEEDGYVEDTYGGRKYADGVLNGDILNFRTDPVSTLNKQSRLTVHPSVDVGDMFSQEVLNLITPFFNPKTFEVPVIFNFFYISGLAYDSTSDCIFYQTIPSWCLDALGEPNRTVGIYFDLSRSSSGASSAPSGTDADTSARWQRIMVFPTELLVRAIWKDVPFSEMPKSWTPQNRHKTYPFERPFDLSLINDARIQRASVSYPWDLCAVLFHEMLHASDLFDNEVFDHRYADGTLKPWGLRDHERRAVEISSRLVDMLYTNPHPKHWPNSSWGSSLLLSP